MNAYIVNRTTLHNGQNSDEGRYALTDESGRTFYERWCSNRAFANSDLTRGNPKILHDLGITAVYSNGELVWLGGAMTPKALQEFRDANEEYERIHCN